MSKKFQFSMDRATRLNFARKVCKKVKEGSSLKTAIMSSWREAGIVQNYEDNPDNTYARLYNALLTAKEYIEREFREQVLEHKHNVPPFAGATTREILASPVMAKIRELTPEQIRNCPAARRNLIDAYRNVEKFAVSNREFIEAEYPNMKNLFVERDTAALKFIPVSGGSTVSTAEMYESADDFLAELSTEIAEVAEVAEDSEVSAS